ncbi:MAG: hypothetical protein R3B36_35595 [Polyangiaceae bacterium]
MIADADADADAGAGADADADADAGADADADAGADADAIRWVKALASGSGLTDVTAVLGAFKACARLPRDVRGRGTPSLPLRGASQP